jgi:hypothetical protein
MKRKTVFFPVLFLALIMALSAGCSKSEDNSTPTPPTGTDCTGLNPGFSAEVLPLITAHCATNSGCHATGSMNSGGALTNYSQISARASNIKTQVAAGTMPQGSTLTASQKATIICWVSNGAANN